MVSVQKWIERGERGQAVWLPELRESCAKAENCVPVIFRLDNGGEIERVYHFPRWNNQRERALVKEYLCACVYNLLAAFGGRRLTCYLEAKETGLVDLIKELNDVFQLENIIRSGYGKPASVSNRINHSLGFGELSFTVADIAEYKPLARPQKRADGALAERLKAAVERSGKGCCCGLDVGGTDIKIVGAREGKLVLVREYDWNPAGFDTAEKIIAPIVELARECRESLGGAPLDGIGLSFPDVVIRNKIVGGETPKTKGIRENPALEYEAEFEKISLLEARLKELCRTGAPVRIINDGSMTAFTAAVELAESGADVDGGVFALSLGTDLGTGWFMGDGRVPEMPLELYDFLLDLGSRPQRALPPEDLRSILNENSGLPGVRRYLGQAAAYRLAMEKNPALLDGFLAADAVPQIAAAPADLRKPCLEHLMELAARGDDAAQDIFLQIGRNLGILNREAEFVLGELPKTRYLFGRFAKKEQCFKLIKEGFEATAPEAELLAADEHMAFTALMKQLRDMEDVTVAQYAQAVGAIYFACMEEKNETKRDKQGTAGAGGHV